MLSEWDKNPNFVTEEFFKKIVALTILFKESDSIVRKQPWYDSYKANIVAYTLAADLAKQKKTFQNQLWTFKLFGRIKISQ